MKFRARWWWSAAALALLAAGAWKWHDDRATRFLPADTSAFITLFEAPPAPDSSATRAELDELLAMQSARTAADAAAAQADRKTEISRFYGALGFDEEMPELPYVESLAELVEDDVRIYVRAVKDHHRRLRPYEIEPRLKPCIDNVAGDLSYPSGHAAFAWSMAWLLAEIAQDRREALEKRAQEFARQRMVCGVHFPSDLAAGKRAARLLLDDMKENRDFQARLGHAGKEYQDAIARRAAPGKN